jgi:hypothetical protein
LQQLQQRVLQVAAAKKTLVPAWPAREILFAFRLAAAKWASAEETAS